MRIIGGKYGGRKLVTFKVDHIRPTTDRVKEVIFNKLQFRIEGAQVLDLFSGTGSLAFEALSRGATQVQAVEMSKSALKIIQKNKQLLQVGSELLVDGMDALKFLARHPQAFDIILVDPPFTKKMADSVLQAIADSACWHSQSEVFIEATSQESFRESYGAMRLRKKQSFGDKYLLHYIFS
jgi:16S rRNA (guanine966-N2)-methyltransferase